MAEEKKDTKKQTEAKEAAPAKKAETKKPAEKKSPAKKTEAKNTPAKKVDSEKKPAEKKAEEKKATKKSEGKTAEKKADDKSATKKPAVKKQAEKKPVEKKPAEKKSAAQKAQEAAKAAKTGDTKKTKTKKASTKKDKKSEPKLPLTKEEKKAAKAAKKAEKKAAKAAGKKGKKRFGKKQPELVEVNLSKKELRAKRREENKPKRMEPRKKKAIQRTVWVCCLCVIAFFGVVTCFQWAGKMEPNAGLALRVDNAETRESEVTNYIKHNTYYSYYSKSASNWGQFLSQYGMKPETFRKQVIEDKFEHDELVRRACSDKEDIEVTEEDIDTHVQALRDKFNSDSAYQNGLSEMGYDEQSYRESVETSALEKKLKEKVAPEVTPSDADMVTYMNTNKSTYNGAKRSSHILFSLADKEKAQSVLDQLKAGTITWEAAVQNSTDTSSKEKNGDVGWDKCNSFVSAYTTALGKLEKDGMSEELVQSDYGYHIIKCTDKWTAPDTITSVSEVPEDILSYCKDKKKSSDQDTTFSTYLDNLKTELGIIVEIYDMPENVPYNIDMSKYGSSSSNISSGSQTVNSDGSVTYGG